MKNTYPTVLADLIGKMASYQDTWFAPVYDQPTKDFRFSDKKFPGSVGMSTQTYKNWLNSAMHLSGDEDMAHALWYALGVLAFYEVDHHFVKPVAHVEVVLASGDSISLILTSLLNDAMASFAFSTHYSWAEQEKLANKLYTTVMATLRRWDYHSQHLREAIEDSNTGFPLSCEDELEFMASTYYEMLWTMFSPLFTGGQLRGYGMCKGDSVGTRQWWNEFMTLVHRDSRNSISVFALLWNQLGEMYGD